MNTIATMYFNIILHGLMLVNFGFNWQKCDTFSIIEALMWVLWDTRSWFLFYRPFLTFFNLHTKNTFTYKKFVSVRHAYILRNKKIYICKREKKKICEREYSLFFFFKKLKDRTKKLQGKRCLHMNVRCQKNKKQKIPTFSHCGKLQNE